MEELELARPARRVVEGPAAVEPDEDVLVVVDPGAADLGRALASACRATDATAVLCVMPWQGGHGEEPPGTVAAAMRGADVVLAANEYSLTHTRARREAAEAGARVLVLRGVTPEMMTEGAMTADFAAVRETTALVCAALSAADAASVTAPAGTDFETSLAGRTALPLDGFFHDYGFANLPPGLAVASPVEGTAEGRIVLDHAMDGLGALDDPIELAIEDCRATEVEGGPDADRLRELLAAGAGDPYNLAEFALGTNPAARLTHDLAECKKRLGVLDVALGDNTSIGGETGSDVHLDAVVTDPTVRLDGTTVVRTGDLDREALRAVTDG
ncbi:aminopeptidase [Halobacteriales archaeon QS_5_70_15]|nr:MAG: aminopeptidase [Halobacteriales archaeon QS_5_70_15]